MIRLRLAGPDTVLTSDLCASCPHSPAGCCASPPHLDYSDIGRIVFEGGLEHLQAELAAGRLRPGDRGLRMHTRKAAARPGEARIVKCGYHDAHGCTIRPEQRPATCNYYLCESALSRDPARAAEARAARDSLASQFERWDALLDSWVIARWPDGPPFDTAFLRALGNAFAELRADAREVTSVEAEGGAAAARRPSPWW